MRTITLPLLMFSTLLATRVYAVDQHSVEAIRQAVESPIPESALQRARQLDDQMLRTGSWNAVKINLVADDRLKRVQRVVTPLLTALGEDPHAWVVRLLDTEPKIVNAFVDGGRYVYVYTGLIDVIKSDDELAVVLGHELGHSVLQHALRANRDASNSFANIAAVVGQLAGGKTRQVSTVMYQTVHNGYSRDDEREADAFGALLAWQAGFEPIAGAAFFGRLQQMQEASAAGDEKALEDYKAKALAVKAQCETYRQQWASGQAAHTQQNADLISERCATYTRAMNAYNSEIAENERGQAQGSDHPENQERLAAIAAETDFFHRARTIQSLSSYPSTQRVLVALAQAKHPVITGKFAVRHSDGSGSQAATVKADTQPKSASTPSGGGPAASSSERDHETEADRASQAAIAAERERITKARAEDQQAAAKAKLAKCKPEDMECRREAW